MIYEQNLNLAIAIVNLLDSLPEKINKKELDTKLFSIIQIEMEKEINIEEFNKIKNSLFENQIMKNSGTDFIERDWRWEEWFKFIKDTERSVRVINKFISGDLWAGNQTGTKKETNQANQIDN